MTSTPGASMQGMQASGLNFALDSGGFTQVSMQTAQNMIQQGDPSHKISLVAYETNLTLPQGNVIHAMTFNGTVPAPTIRVTQGDLINVTLINPSKNKNGHSLDNHAAIISAVPNFGPVMPGQERSYAFIATQPGFFKYHCEGVAVIGMDQHVFSGMVGGVIVDPVKGYTGYTYPTYDSKGSPISQTVSPNAKEVQFIFSEWYLTKDGNYNQSAMFNHDPTFVWMNGIPFGYDPVITKTKGAMPLHFKQGDHVRFFLLNEGDVPVNFHIVGAQLDRVISGSVVQGMGKQTYLLGGSNDAIIDVVFTQPGAFAPVNHDYASLFRGQAGIIAIDPPDGSVGKLLGLKDFSNPSNAIPPMGKDSIPVQTTPYQLGTPLKMTSAQIGPLKECKAETCP
ncbi:MAG TPA: multicopper oxidase domain-containing protein [Candidatus Nitrosopolaris sp.]|nr:multicopper oxidase domain-containing protein [Candidatus Nitrosopolaris sp.]